MNHPLVSLFCPTYNHEKYIRQCLDGFIMQKTNFPFEIVVHDDASTDNTVQIIKEYEEKYPQFFRCIYQTQNQFSKDGAHLIKTILSEIHTKYITICEGDDYWITDDKLQEQFNCMETHPKLSFCYTNANNLIEGEDGLIQMITNKPNFHIFDFDYFTKESSLLIPTLTLFIRRDAFFETVPTWFKTTFNLDYALICFLFQKGNVAYIDKVTAVYRNHRNGITKITKHDIQIRNGIQLAKNLDKHFNYKYHHYFNLQWRYQALTLYYLQKRMFLKGISYLILSFIRKPIEVLKDIRFQKNIYKVLFRKFIMYN